MNWWRLCVALVVVGVSVNAYAASPRDSLPMAVIEAPPNVTRHLSLKGGHLQVGSKHTWDMLRQFRVKIVETPAATLDFAAELPADTSLRIQLQTQDFPQVGINALPGPLPGVAFEDSTPFYRYFICGLLNVRVSMRDTKGEPTNIRYSTFVSHGVAEHPDAAGTEQALVNLVIAADQSTRRAIGVRMLQVGKGTEGGLTTFYVGVENVFSFPIEGTVKLPDEANFRVVGGEKPFVLAPGEATEFKMQLVATSAGAAEVIPTWWTRRYSNIRERYRAFEFPELELNASVTD